MRWPVDEMLAYWEGDGSVSPRWFTLRGEKIRVDSTGRSWRDAEGYHVLCMTHAGAVYELVLTPSAAWEARLPRELEKG
uniref:Uncharacterized protein n=1 Tax=Anaerolinea thermolimosa TaxID=229919 RepID=A0A7C4PLM8_9CHLR